MNVLREKHTSIGSLLGADLAIPIWGGCNHYGIITLSDGKVHLDFTPDDYHKNTWHEPCEYFFEAIKEVMSELDVQNYNLDYFDLTFDLPFCEDTNLWLMILAKKLGIAFHKHRNKLNKHWMRKQ